VLRSVQFHEMLYERLFSAKGLDPKALGLDGYFPGTHPLETPGLESSDSGKDLDHDLSQGEGQEVDQEMDQEVVPSQDSWGGVVPWEKSGIRVGDGARPRDLWMVFSPLGRRFNRVFLEALKDYSQGLDDLVPFFPFFGWFFVQNPKKSLC
jgi:hypothetical protein